MKAQPHPITFSPIGVIRTPYAEKAPYQPIDDDSGNFRIVLFAAHQDGLLHLERFRCIYILYHTHKAMAASSPLVNPPWTAGTTVGIFASRSPRRPNGLGLSVVRLRGIEKNVIYTSGLDVFDGTPLLDIKPYIQDLDVKMDANYGWLEEIKERDHLILHIKGIPHDY